MSRENVCLRASRQAEERRRFGLVSISLGVHIERKADIVIRHGCGHRLFQLDLHLYPDHFRAQAGVQSICGFVVRLGVDVKLTDAARLRQAHHLAANRAAGKLRVAAGIELAEQRNQADSGLPAL